MTTSIKSSIKRGFVVGFILLMLATSAYSQPIETSTSNKSQIAVTTTDSKTNVLVTGFPAKTTVVIFDTENNLLSIVSTNDDGAASVTLPPDIKNTIYAKTLNGEIMVSGKTNKEGIKAPEVFAMKKRTVVNRV
jgi:hypothetical protein